MNRPTPKRREETNLDADKETSRLILNMAVTEHEKGAWIRASRREKMKLETWVRKSLNLAASENA